MVEVPSFWAIMPAAGVGSRIDSHKPKQYLSLQGRALIEHSLTALLQSQHVRGVMLGLHADDSHWKKLNFQSHKTVQTFIGGESRAQTVFNALELLQQDCDSDAFVLVHDAARPCLTERDISALVNACEQHAVGGLLAAPVGDTIKNVSDDHQVLGTVDRSALWRALTPQMFRLGALYDALKYCFDNNLSVTDEASAIEHKGENPIVVQGDTRNIKVTYAEDLSLAEHVLGGG